MMSVDGGSNIIVSSTLNKSGKYFILEYDENQQFISSTGAPEYSKKATFILNEETAFINIDLGNGTEPCTVANTGNFIVEYQKIFILNGNNVYEEFRKKEEINIVTGVEFKTRQNY